MLQNLGLPHEWVIKEDIDGESFFFLTDEILEKFGLTWGMRQKILQLQPLKEEVTKQLDMRDIFSNSWGLQCKKEPDFRGKSHDLSMADLQKKIQKKRKKKEIEILKQKMRHTRPKEKITVLNMKENQRGRSYLIQMYLFQFFYF